MNSMKKILALVVALLLVLGMTSAFAASITITHDESYEGAEGTTARVYSAYKIFDASYKTLAGENTQQAKDTFDYDPDDAAVSYSIAANSPWLSVMQSNSQTWFDIVELPGDNTKYVIKAKEGAMTTSAHAKAFGDYLAANIPATATATDVTVDGAAASVGAGYYLIVGKDTKDAVTRVAVVTTDVTMVEKNTYITTGKTTSETSYNVGDTVTYTATVFIPSDTAITEEDPENEGQYKEGHGPVILHDKMDSELTFSGSATAAIGETAFTGFTLNDAPADNDTFDISIPVTNALLGQTITFTYTAIVNDTAATDDGFVNELFGELNGYKTNKDDVEVWTFDFSFKKDFTGANADTTLQAKFKLYPNVHTDAAGETPASDAPGTTAIKFNAKDGHKYEKSDDTSGTEELVIVDEETLNIVGLKEGTYWLVETETSTGYNLLDGPVKVVITDTSTQNATGVWTHSHTVTTEGDNIDANGVIQVENNSGTVLPSTGGIGTTIFYVGGGILVLAAVILLVTKRRMSTND